MIMAEHHCNIISSISMMYVVRSPIIYSKEKDIVKNGLYNIQTCIRQIIYHFDIFRDLIQQHSLFAATFWSQMQMLTGTHPFVEILKCVIKKQLYIIRFKEFNLAECYFFKYHNPLRLKENFLRGCEGQSQFQFEVFNL